jgi:hypothetical protein
MAIEDYILEATSEIEEQKPLTKDVNGVVSELSNAEYDEKITALAAQKDYDANQSYKDNRSRVYPSFGEQLDKLFHDIDGGLLGEDAKTGSLYLALKEVKDDNPKPSE